MMQTEDIKNLVQAFRAKALEEAREEQCARATTAQAAERTRHEQARALIDILPAVREAMSLASFAFQPEHPRILVFYDIATEHRKWPASFSVRCLESNGAIGNPPMFIIRPGESGKFLNKWLWNISGPAHEVIIKLAEFNGRALARGRFISSKGMA